MSQGMTLRPVARGTGHRAFRGANAKNAPQKNALHANAYYLKIFQDIPMEDCSGWPQSGPRVAKERAQDDPRMAQAVWPQDDPRMTKGRPKDSSRMAPGWPQDDPRMDPGWPKDNPRIAPG